MSYFSQKGATGPLPFNGVSSDQSLTTLVGSKFETPDGREFVVVQNAGTALVAGNLIQGPAKIANHQNLATSTQAVGDKVITVTAGGTLITANQYAGGYILINASTGQGQFLKIASHPSATSSGTCLLTLEDALTVATVAATTKSCLSLNPYGSSNGTDFRTSGVVVCPTTLTGQVIGVTISPIVATTTTVLSYGLIQTRGPVACLNDANTAIGLDLMPSANTAGAVATYVAATSSRVGTATQAGVTTESRLITIQL